MSSASNRSRSFKACPSAESSGERQPDKELRRIAHSDLNVLMTGEPGEDLGNLARTIHGESPRRKSPFVRAERPFTELQALGRFLGGGELPAFLSPNSPSKPATPEIPRGTLFIDRVGELPAEAQRILLRVLESREGGATGRGLDIRVIATASVHLPELVSTGRFRSDLYFRLEEIRITAPCLLANTARRAKIRAEKRAIERALLETRGDRDLTAQLLSMTTRALNRKMRDLRLK